MKLKRVYVKNNRYYFVDTANKWHGLTRVEEGEDALLRAYLKRPDVFAVRPGSMMELVSKWWQDHKAGYEESTRQDYEYLFPKIERGFEDFDVAEITPADVYDFIRQWADKPRQANKYLHVLSMMFAFACAPLRIRNDNPCDQVKTLDTGPKRNRYITDREFHRIRNAAMFGKDGWKNPSGPIIVCAMDLAYLTFQREHEILNLRWSDTDPEWVTFQPKKTETTTGAKVRWRRTAELDTVLERARAFGKVKPIDGFVIHTLRGKRFSRRGFYSAWERACARAGVENATFHDLRGKAQTDAKKRGYTMEQIRDGATHASEETTRGYIKLREVVDSQVAMTMPKLEDGHNS